MEKNTLIAVVLSVIVISVGFMIQSVLFPVDEPNMAAQSAEQSRQPSATERSSQDSGTIGQANEGIVASDQEAPPRPTVEQETETLPAQAAVAAQEQSEGDERLIEYETDVFLITFSTRGGEIVSMKLKDHLDNGRMLEMILNGERDRGAFSIRFGGPQAQAVSDTFRYRLINDNTHEFSKVYLAPGSDGTSVPFTLRKTYSFTPKDYLFEVRISIENSERELPNLNQDGYAYTLGFGPQIGPEFEKLDGRYEYRRYYTYTDGNRDTHRLRSGPEVIQERITWAAISGKYFAVAGVPDATLYTVTLDNTPVPGIPETSRLFFSRPPVNSSVNEDVFRFYVGPKRNNVLTRYNDVDKNGFGVRDLNLEKVMDSSSILGWLEWILKKFLQMFYMIVPNYGVAIILLTILIKILLYPITHKSFESTSKMQALNPKIAELKEKYKDNSNKLNQEMAALYKKEGVNPLGGCLPLLMQMPIFIALYGLLNKHFELRGAPFALWIQDLSAPESIYNFAPTSIPLIGSDLRLLPLLMVGFQLLSSKMMQTPDAQTNKNMKYMTYGMPIFILFILYDAPSGLLLYWICQSILTTIQQQVTTKIRATHPGGGGTDTSGSGSKDGPKSSPKGGPKSSPKGDSKNGPKKGGSKKKK